MTQLDQSQIWVSQIQKGRRFQELQDNPIFRELLVEADKFILNKWQQCRIDDEATQKEAKLELEAMKKLGTMVHGFIKIGEHAQKELEKLEKKK